MKHLTNGLSFKIQMTIKHQGLEFHQLSSQSSYQPLLQNQINK